MQTTEIATPKKELLTPILSPDKIKLYDCLTKEQYTTVKNSDIRNCFLIDLTIDEARELESIIGCTFINNFLSVMVSVYQNNQ